MHCMSAASSPLQQMRAALASGEITARTVAEQALARANSNAGRNVYIARVPEWTLREAEGLPGRFGAAARPLLYGLPISLKDCFDLAGFPTSCGSRFYVRDGVAAREDSAVAARLRSQGAVIVGKTHMHPLAYGITGENPDYGDCVQPSDARWLTGGSSSGGAASVQEGSAVAAIGTDTGGSIRVPAALCGLAGYRASIELAHQCELWRGELWRGGVHLAPSFDTLGWLFRDLRDGPLLAEALFGLRVPATAEKRVRIGCVGAEFLHDCEPGALDSLARWRQRLAERGAEIAAFDASFWDEAMAIYAPIQAHEAAAIHIAKTEGDFSHFEPSIAERLVWGASISAAEMEGLHGRLAAFRDRVDALLREHDFLIAPCAPVCRLAAGADHRETRRLILRYTTPISLAGLPVVTLPGEGGAGVQLAAGRGKDARLLAYAAALA
jgi:Asp-tRNA(Asn)/Glu-tRNA(Gln) amidotransferase A subunit family amidase